MFLLRNGQIGRDRQTDRETDREADRQTDRQTDRQKGTGTYTERDRVRYKEPMNVIDCVMS